MACPCAMFPPQVSYGTDNKYVGVSELRWAELATVDWCASRLPRWVPPWVRVMCSTVRGHFWTADVEAQVSLKPHVDGAITSNAADTVEPGRTRCGISRHWAPLSSLPAHPDPAMQTQGWHYLAGRMRAISACSRHQVCCCSPERRTETRTMRDPLHCAGMRLSGRRAKGGCRKRLQKRLLAVLAGTKPVRGSLEVVGRAVTPKRGSSARKSGLLWSPRELSHL